MINITFDVSGVALVQQKFASYGADVSDLSVPLGQVADDLQADFTLNMATEGGLFGGWVPLAASTIQERVREGYGASPILYRTGRLANSLSGDGADTVKEVTDKSVTVGTSVPYGIYHQTGTHTKSGAQKMPQRKIIWATFARRGLIVRRLGDYIRQLAVKQGLA